MTLPLYDEEIALGDGVQTVFEFDFRIDDPTFVRVFLETIATGIRLEIDSTDYTVAGVGDEDGGSITFLTAPTSLQRVIIISSFSYVQSTNLLNQSGFYPAAIEEGMDKLARLTQQLNKDVGRSIRLAPGESAISSLPGALARRGKVLAFDTAGAPVLEELPIVVAVEDPSALVFENAAAVALTPITILVSQIRIRGYSQPNLGGGTYKRINAIPNHTGYLQSADGAIWEIMDEELSIEQFNAPVDGVSDDGPAFINMITAALNRSTNTNNGVIRVRRRYNFTTAQTVALTSASGQIKRLTIKGYAPYTSALLKSTPEAKIQFTSPDSTKIIILFEDFSIEPNCAGAGLNFMFEWIGKDGSGAQHRFTARNVCFAPQVDDSGFWAKKAMRLELIHEARFYTNSFLLGSGDPYDRVDTAVELKNCDYPRFYQNQINGGQNALYGIRKIDDQATEGLTWKDGFLVGFEYNFYVERQTGNGEPGIEISGGHMNSPYCNVYIDGAVDGYINNILFLQGPNYTYTYGQSGTTITITANKPHYLQVGDIVIVSHWNGGGPVDGTTYTILTVTTTTFTISDGVTRTIASGHSMNVSNTGRQSADVWVKHASGIMMDHIKFGSGTNLGRRHFKFDPTKSYLDGVSYTTRNVSDITVDLANCDLNASTNVEAVWIDALCERIRVNLPPELDEDVATSYPAGLIKDLGDKTAITVSVDYSVIGLMSYLRNGTGRIRSRAAAALANGAYGLHDGWYSLSEVGTVTPSQLTNVQDGLPNMMRLTNTAGAGQRHGYAQAIRSLNCKPRGQNITLAVWLRRSNTTTVTHVAILGWPGTVNQPVKDVVNAWANPIFTSGQFFKNTYEVLATDTVNPGQNILGFKKLTAKISPTTNNVVVFIWTDGQTADTTTMDLAVWLFPGVFAPTYAMDRPLAQEQLMCGEHVQAKTVQSENGSRHIPLYPPMFANPTVTVGVGSAAHATPDGFELTHVAAADCTVLAVAEIGV